MHNCILNVLYKRQRSFYLLKSKFHGSVEPWNGTAIFLFDNHMFRVLLLHTKTLTMCTSVFIFNTSYY